MGKVEIMVEKLRKYRSFVADLERTCNKQIVARVVTYVSWGTQVKSVAIGTHVCRGAHMHNIVAIGTHVCRGAHIHTYYGDRQEAVTTVTVF